MPRIHHRQYAMMRPGVIGQPLVIGPDRAFDEPFFNEVLSFPSAYAGYAIMRPRVSHLTYPDVLPPNLEGFTISAISDVYVWTIASIAKAGWSLVAGISAIGSYGNTYKLYKYSAHAAGTVTTWGADGLDTTNGDIVNLPPLFMVPNGITITATPIPYSWQVIGGGVPAADKIASQIDTRYWTDVDINAPSTDANGNAVVTINWAGNSAATITAIEAAINAASPGDYFKYNNTNPLTGVLTITSSGSWSKSIRLYVSDPNTIALSAAGRIAITGDHIEIVGWAKSGSTNSGTKSTTGATFGTAANADWCVFHHCSEFDQSSGTTHATIYFGGRMTGWVRGFSDCTHPHVGDVSANWGTQYDGAWMGGYSTGAAVNTYIPCGFVRASWFEGNASGLVANTDLTTPLQCGENTGNDMATLYGYWTCSLIYRNLFKDIQAGVELITNKNCANHFIQNRYRACAGMAGSRGGFFHSFIGEWIDSGGPSVATIHKRGGYRIVSSNVLVLNAYLSGINTAGSFGAGSRVFTFQIGNGTLLAAATPAYVPARDVLIAYCTIKDPDALVLSFNQEGSTGPWIDPNQRIYVVNTVIDAPGETLAEIDSPASVVDSSNQFSNDVFRYSALGVAGSAVGIPASSVPALTVGADGIYRATSGGNLGVSKTLTVKFKDAAGAARTSYIGAYEPGFGDVFPVTLTTGVGGSVGPETTLLSGF